MIDFKRFFFNHFASVRISDEEMKDFSQDGIGRIAANNGGGLFTTSAIPSAPIPHIPAPSPIRM